MLSKCVNPACSASFRYLHQGRLFLLDVADDADIGRLSCHEGLAAHRLRYFWLCDACCRSMTVVERGRGVEVVSLTPTGGEKAAS